MGTGEPWDRLGRIRGVGRGGRWTKRVTLSGWQRSSRQRQHLTGKRYSRTNSPMLILWVGRRHSANAGGVIRGDPA